MAQGIPRRSFLIGAGAAALAAPALARPAAAQRGDKVALRLNAPAYGEHAPFAIGLDKKFFAEEGIDLTLREGQGSGATVQIVGSKADPIGYADTATTIKAIAKGLPVRTVAVFQQLSPQAIIFLKEKGYKTPRDLENASIALTAGDSIHQLFPAFARKNGVDPNKVRLLFMETAAKSTAVVSGKADAMGGFYTTQAANIAAAAKKDIAWLKYSDYGVNTLAQGILVHQEFLKDKADVVRRFLKAAVRSWTYADQHPQESVEALLKMYPASAFLAQSDQGFKQWEYHRQLMRAARAKGKIPGWVAREDIQDTIDLLAEFGGLEPKGKPEDYVTNEFLPA
jgi:NitT/TauT family transport system substrate-binding protein